MIKTVLAELQKNRGPQQLYSSQHNIFISSLDFPYSGYLNKRNIFFNIKFDINKLIKSTPVCIDKLDENDDSMGINECCGIPAESFYRVGQYIVERNEKQYFWDFNGEFWADELGDYVFALKSEC